MTEDGKMLNEMEGSAVPEDWRSDEPAEVIEYSHLCTNPWCQNQWQDNCPVCDCPLCGQASIGKEDNEVPVRN